MGKIFKILFIKEFYDILSSYRKHVNPSYKIKHVLDTIQKTKLPDQTTNMSSSTTTDLLADLMNRALSLHPSQLDQIRSQTCLSRG